MVSVQTGTFSGHPESVSSAWGASSGALSFPLIQCSQGLLRLEIRLHCCIILASHFLLCCIFKGQQWVWEETSCPTLASVPGSSYITVLRGTGDSWAVSHHFPGCPLLHCSHHFWGSHLLVVEVKGQSVGRDWLVNAVVFKELDVNWSLVQNLWVRFLF